MHVGRRDRVLVASVRLHRRGFRSGRDGREGERERDGGLAEERGRFVRGDDGGACFSGELHRWGALREGAVPGRRGRKAGRMCVSMAADYYSTLGVPKSASKQDIKSAYRKLARQVSILSRSCVLVSLCPHFPPHFDVIVTICQ